MGTTRTTEVGEHTVVIRRLGLLHDWATELYGRSGNERQRLHERGFENEESLVLEAVETAMSDWSPLASWLAKGRSLRTREGVRAKLERSLFERREVTAFLAKEEGFTEFRRYMESAEMLRLALLEYVVSTEAAASGPGHPGHLA